MAKLLFFSAQYSKFPTQLENHHYAKKIVLSADYHIAQSSRFNTDLFNCVIIGDYYETIKKEWYYENILANTKDIASMVYFFNIQKVYFKTMDNIILNGKYICHMMIHDLLSNTMINVDEKVNVEDVTTMHMIKCMLNDYAAENKIILDISYTKQNID